MPAKPPADPALPPVIAMASTLKRPELAEAVAVYNGMIKRNDVLLFPDDLPADMVYAHLHGEVATEAGWQSAVKGETQAVEEKRDVMAEGKVAYAQLLKAVNNALPIGSVGRAEYFPAGNADHTPGELMVAMAAGYAKRAKPPVPKKYTLAGVQQLGADMVVAETSRDSSEAQRKGISASRKNAVRQTREIRKRLRGAVQTHYGADSTDMLFYGIPVKGPRKSPKKAKVVAIEPKG